MSDTSIDIARDGAAVARIEAIPTLLRVICEITGAGFAAVARVTDDNWTVCAVLDNIPLGLAPGGQLDVDTTLCKEVRRARTAIVIDHASEDPAFCNHPTPKMYGFESYISVPIVTPGGAYFGNLCALDPRPIKLSEPRIVSLFALFAELIGLQLENERRSELQQSALTDAHASADLREQFIAVLGHDLRNPLGVVTTGAAVLNALSSDPQVVAVAQRIARSARRMSALIDDVLDFARGRLGGGFSVRLTEVHDLGLALHEIVDEVRSAHPDARIDVSIESPGAVRCDRTRVQQLAANLLANAVQHGDAGKPIGFSARVSEQSIVLTVTNQGAPIPQDSLAKVFQPFWRHGTSSEREGLGLGLFICAEIARAHGGQIEVISSSAHGTTFAARLPISGRAPS